MATDSLISRPRLVAGLIGFGLAGAALLYQLDPTRAGSGLPPCPFNWLTGLYCPGCGATRAIHALVHFDLAAALSMNPLLVLAVPVVALLLADFAGWLPAGWRPLLGWVTDARVWAILVIAFGITRNLPWLPFAWLAPGV